MAKTCDNCKHSYLTPRYVFKCMINKTPLDEYRKIPLTKKGIPKWCENKWEEKYQ